MNDGTKFVCKECGWCGLGGDRLVAPNPFDPAGTIYGCPVCLVGNCFRVACDKDG